jgi:hypothetical protein
VDPSAGLTPPAPRIITRFRTMPRAWGRYVSTEDRLLTDRAWIIRRIRQTGTEHGAPNYQERSLGPYAALLSNPTWAESRDADKYSIDVTHTIAIACDVHPLISDFLDVAALESSRTALQNPNLQSRRYRISGDVQERRSKFGRVLIFHCLLAVLEED